MTQGSKKDIEKNNGEGPQKSWFANAVTPKIPKPWKTRSDKTKDRDRLRISLWAGSIKNALFPKSISKDQVSRAMKGLSTDRSAKDSLMALSKRQVSEEVLFHKKVRVGSAVMFGLSFAVLGSIVLFSDDLLVRLGSVGGMIAALSILILFIKSDWRILQLEKRDPIGLKDWAQYRLFGRNGRKANA